MRQGAQWGSERRDGVDGGWLMGRRNAPERTRNRGVAGGIVCGRRTSGGARQRRGRAVLARWAVVRCSRRLEVESQVESQIVDAGRVTGWVWLGEQKLMAGACRNLPRASEVAGSLRRGAVETSVVVCEQYRRCCCLVAANWARQTTGLVQRRERELFARARQAGTHLEHWPRG